MWGWELIIYDYSQYLIKKGYEVFWLLYSKPTLNFKPFLDGIQLIRLEKRYSWENPKEDISLLFALVHTLKKYNISVLYTRAAFLGFIAGFSSKITRTPFIFHVEDLASSLIIDGIGASLKTKMYYPYAVIMCFFQKCATILANKILTVSKTFKNFLVNNWSIANEKITVVYEGVEVHMREKTTQHKIPHLKKNTFSMVYVGGTGNYDGIDILIEAFAKIAEKFKGIELIIGIFSTEHQCLHLKGLCRSLNIAERVRFLTSITGEKARSLVQSSDIAIIARKRTMNSELTTTSVIFLYISEGIPIIAPRLRAILELMNGNALFFQPGNVDSLANAMMKLISDNEFRKALHSRVLELKDTLSRERMCKRLNDIIETLI